MINHDERSRKVDKLMTALDAALEDMKAADDIEAMRKYERKYADALDEMMKFMMKNRGT